MKLNKNWAVVAAIALLGVGLLQMRPARAEQQTRTPGWVVLYCGVAIRPDGVTYDGLAVYASSSGAGSPTFPQYNYQYPTNIQVAEVLAQLYAQGFSIDRALEELSGQQTTIFLRR